MDFKEWFCLNQRESFTIDANINPFDARFYFGRKEIGDRMKKQLARAFVDPQVPKMMVWGPYGCGKTQTLHNLAYGLENAKPASCKGTPHVVHLDIEVQSKSTAANWHLQNMESLGMQAVQQWVKRLFDNSTDFEKEVNKLTSDPNVAKVFAHLRGAGDLRFNAWRWLSGQKLSAKELQDIGVTRNLGDVGVGDLVSALQACGNLAKAVGECLIFFIDEMEELQNVREGDAAESWHQYIRKLSDNANSSVGFVIGFKADTRDDAPRVLVRPDVFSRVGAHNYIELDTLSVIVMNKMSDELRLIAVSALLRRLMASRVQASEAEKHLKILETLKPQEKAVLEALRASAVPPTWVCIDEAQNMLPSERRTSATDVIVKYVREGRNYGLSFVVATQQPTAIDPRILAQVDTLLVHKLTVQGDIDYIRKNIKSNLPEEVKYGNATLDFDQIIRSLDVGQALVSVP
jgi:DNA polymerase III delta prime subunit